MIDFIGYLWYNALGKKNRLSIIKLQIDFLGKGKVKFV